jgi:hypothetical protein
MRAATAASSNSWTQRIAVPPSCPVRTTVRTKRGGASRFAQRSRIGCSLGRQCDYTVATDRSLGKIPCGRTGASTEKARHPLHFTSMWFARSLPRYGAADTQSPSTPSR